MIDEKVGPVKNMIELIKHVLFVIMFEILKSCQKYIIAPVKHEKFVMASVWTSFVI